MRIAAKKEIFFVLAGKIWKKLVGAVIEFPGAKQQQQRARQLLMSSDDMSHRDLNFVRDFLLFFWGRRSTCRILFQSLVFIFYRFWLSNQHISLFKRALYIFRACVVIEIVIVFFLSLQHKQLDAAAAASLFFIGLHNIFFKEWHRPDAVSTC